MKPQQLILADPDETERSKVAVILSDLAREIGATVEIHHASDGDALQKLCESIQPDLVVSEVLLPGRSGLQVLRTLRKNPTLAETPVLFLSAMTRPSDRYWGLRNGAHAYVFKPYDEMHLRDRLRTLLKEGRAAQRDKL